MRAFDYWRGREFFTLPECLKLAPCLRRCIDGIFWPEAAGSDGFQDVPSESSFSTLLSEASFGNLLLSKKEPRASSCGRGKLFG